MMKIPTRFDFVLGEERLGIKGFTGFEIHRAFSNLLGSNGVDFDGIQYSLTPLSRENSGTRFSVYSWDSRMREAILKLMLSNETHTLRFGDREVPLIKISVENVKLPDLPVKKGSSLWLRFLTPVVLPGTFPTLEELYRAIFSLTSEEEIEVLVDRALTGISTPHFKLKSTRYHDADLQITGFRGSVQLVIENEEGLETLPPALGLATMTGLGEYTSLGFGRVEVVSGGEKS